MNSSITFAELIRLSSRNWKTIAAVMCAFVVTALLYLRFATYTYAASLDVTPVESGPMDGLEAQLGGLSGLASLAGVSLQSGRGSGSFNLYVESLRSRAVADELAEDNGLMQVIFSPEWSSQEQQWKKPRGVVVAVKSIVVWLAGAKGFEWSQPDGARLREYLDRRLTIVQSTKRPVVTVIYAHSDPRFARRLLEALHKVADGQIRKRTLIRVNENIAYLTTKLETVRNVEHQRAIAQTLSDQEKIKMMASSDVAFAAEPFGEPATSYRPNRPQPIVVLVSAGALGLIGGVAVVLAMYLIRRAKQSRVVQVQKA